MLELKTVDAAGGLVVNRNGDMLFIFKSGRWDLPKGILDRSGPAHEIARAEVSEETGLPAHKLRVATELIPTSHISKFNKKKWLKQTRWFLILYVGEDDEFVPQKSEGIEHCKWFSPWDIDRPLANCPSRINYLVRFWMKIKKEIDLTA